jgi:hypothetical protein
MSLRRHISCCRPTAAFVESVSGVSANPLVNVLVCRLVAICYPRDALPTAQCNQNTHTHTCSVPSVSGSQEMCRASTGHSVSCSVVGCEWQHVRLVERIDGRLVIAGCEYQLRSLLIVCWRFSCSLLWSCQCLICCAGCVVCASHT